MQLDTAPAVLLRGRINSFSIGSKWLGRLRKGGMENDEDDEEEKKQNASEGSGGDEDKGKAVRTAWEAETGADREGECDGMDSNS